MIRRLNNGNRKNDSAIGRTEMNTVKIGLLGCGSIGGFLARYILAKGADDSIKLDYVFDVDEKRLQDIPSACRITKQVDLFSREADLVVEAAQASLLKEVALGIVEHSDLLLFSITALADDAFCAALEKTAVKSGRKVFLPHGAMIGIDGLADAGPTLKSVTVTTTKSPASLGLPPEKYAVVYEGPTREACGKFPKNVNVHAAIALAGLGFDLTTSRIIADPAVSTNSHLVEVEGTGYRFRIDVSSEAGGKVTGAYTPQSALGTLKRICNTGGGLRFA
jgi:aspartate dehydrogenase